MKIYTKTGDGGSTGLQGGHRTTKSGPRIAAYGAIDEANAALGIVLSDEMDDDVSNVLIKIQNDLFVAGSDLSNPDLSNTKCRISPSMASKLESVIDQFESELPLLTNFILPGGVSAAAKIHYARTVVRRAETLVVSLGEKEEINPECVIYLNRLSDLLFVIGRLVNKRAGNKDILWK